jgi:hypothetical protein
MSEAVSKALQRKIKTESVYKEKIIKIPDEIANIYTYFDMLFMGGVRETELSGEILIDLFLLGKPIGNQIEIYLNADYIVNKKGNRKFGRREKRAMNSIETRLRELNVNYQKKYNKYSLDSEVTAIFEIEKDNFIINLHVYGGRKKKENFNINEMFYSKGVLKMSRKAEDGLINKKIEVTNWIKPFETILKIEELEKKYNLEIETEKYYNLLKYTKVLFQNGNYILDEKIKEKIQTEINKIDDEIIDNELESFFDYIRNHCGGDIGRNEEFVTDILKNKDQVTRSFTIPLTEFIPSQESEKEFNNFIEEVKKIEKKIKLENLYNPQTTGLQKLSYRVNIKYDRIKKLSEKLPHLIDNLDKINGLLSRRLRIKERYKKEFFFYLAKRDFEELELKNYLEYINVRSDEEFNRVLKKMEIKEVEVNLALITYYKLMIKNIKGRDIGKLLEEELLNNARIKVEDEKIKIFGRNFIFSDEQEVRGKIRALLKENGI